MISDVDLTLPLPPTASATSSMNAAHAVETLDAYVTYDRQQTTLSVGANSAHEAASGCLGGINMAVGGLAGITHDETAWQQYGLCAQTDPEAFFPELGGSTAAPKRICRACGRPFRR